MPQAASVNNDYANDLQQTGQILHCAKNNHDTVCSSTVNSAFLKMGSSEGHGFLVRFRDVGSKERIVRHILRHGGQRAVAGAEQGVGGQGQDLFADFLAG